MKLLKFSKCLYSDSSINNRKENRLKKECSRSEKTRRLFTSLSPNLFKQLPTVIWSWDNIGTLVCQISELQQLEDKATLASNHIYLAEATTTYRSSINLATTKGHFRKAKRSNCRPVARLWCISCTLDKHFETGNLSKIYRQRIWNDKRDNQKSYCHKVLEKSRALK
jgi:hypothetical protein